MANSSDSSKQKRARQNRAQREALKARTAAASTSPEERRTRAMDTPPTSAKDKGLSKGSAKGAKEPRTRPVRPGDVPVDLETLEGNWLTKRLEVPGGRQALMSFVLSTIASVMLAIQKFPVDDKAKVRTETLLDLVGPWAVPIVLFPILVTGVAAFLTLHPRHRRVWFWTSMLLGLGCVLLMSLYLVHLLSLGFLIFANQKATKVEGPAPGSWSERMIQKRTKSAVDATQDEDSDES